MAKLEQVLVIDPANELAFTGPFTSPVSSIMTLTNPTERKVCFKIKTTAPKKYCVKPNSGVIDPKQVVNVTVSLQPFDFDPNEKNRHKFMVQSTFAPDGEINQDTLWKEADGKLLMDSKLGCVFILPEDANGIAMNGNEYSTAKSELPSIKQTLSSSPKIGEGIDSTMRKSSEEIKKLQEEISALRQENIQLKEEALRQKRLAAAAASSNRPEMSSSSSSMSSESMSISTLSPDQNALSMAYLYAALAILVIGIIVGKWIF